MYKDRLKNFLLIIVILLSVAACKQKAEIPSAKNYDGLVNIEVDRFEEDLFSISPYGLTDSISYLQQKYPDFFPLFTHMMLQIGGPEDEWFLESLTSFITDFTNYRVSQRVQKVYPDMKEVERQLSLGFSNYEGYLPGKKSPRVVSCISGFNQSLVTADSLLAISLDKYLGAEDEFYQLLDPPIPQYMKRNMRPDKIASDALQAWLTTEYPFDERQTNLLSHIIYEGRILYCVKRFLPGISDSLLWGFTQEQMNFCLQHERDMWMHLAEQKKIYNSEPFMIKQFTEPSPFTKEFGQDSPGRAAVWIGYRIVVSYMNSQNDISIEQLMKEGNYLNILNLSKYNP